MLISLFLVVVFMVLSARQPLQDVPMGNLILLQLVTHLCIVILRPLCIKFLYGAFYEPHGYVVDQNDSESFP